MEHLSEEQIAEYRVRVLSGAQVLRVSDHLMQCEACRARAFGYVDPAAGAAAIFASLRSEAGTSAHLSYDEIADFVDGKVSPADAELLRLHTQECEACAADLHGIQSLKAEIDAAQVETSGQKLSGQNFMAGLWRTVQAWKLSFAFAAAAALLLIGLAIRPRQATQIAKVEPPKPSGRTQEPAQPAAANSVIRDGERTITLSASGGVAGLDGLPDRFRGAVEQALAAQRIQVSPVIGDLAAKRSVLLGPPSSSARVQLLEPLGVMVETDHPVFRWKAVPGAEYQVSVYDSEFRPAATSGWTREPEWRTPSGLRRGARYFWQLTLRHDGAEFTVPEAPEPEARFRILDAAEEADLIRLRSVWHNSHLVMGVAYAQAGLLSDARRELEAVADQNPGAPQINALLASVNGAVKSDVNSGRPRSK